jgi:peptide/nickel transport system substrate-binding protein
MNLLAQKIQADLAAVGIGITLNGLPGRRRSSCTVTARISSAPELGGRLPGRPELPVYAPGRTVGKRAGGCRRRAGGAGAAQIAADAESERDPAKSAGLYRKLDERIAQVGPYAPLFQPAVPYAFRSNVRGVTFSSVWGVDFWTVTK